MDEDLGSRARGIEGWGLGMEGLRLGFRLKDLGLKFQSPEPMNFLELQVIRRSRFGLW